MPVRSLVVSLMLSHALGMHAQTVSPASPPVARALTQLRADNEWTLTQQQELCEIPAPPFGEAVRAAAFSRRLGTLGLVRIRTDAEGNVIGERPGRDPNGPRIVLSAHLDTVFPAGTDVTVTRTGTRLAGPGIGDDCRGLAVLLAVGRAMQHADVRFRGTIVFVGTVGEEGAGNLRGVRHLFTEQSAGRIDYFVSVDGTGLNATTAAVGSHRYRVSYSGPGGHSYSAFGMPNPMHALGRAIAFLSEAQVPTTPKTTFSVGIVEGGTSVNAIAATASMEVDLRSESPGALNALDAQFQRAIARALSGERARWPASEVPLEVEILDIGKRPAGAQPDTALIVRATVSAGAALGFSPSLEASSTDSNIPMSLGIPAVTIDGGGSGSGTHSLGEGYDDGTQGWLGPQWALLLLATLAGGPPA